MDESEERWGVGELAAAAGVTVRTLHHYDRLGLLAPVERSGAGYRSYDREGVERLYRILALRDLGFPLAEVGELLDADAGSLREATRARLEQAEAEVARANDLRERLRRVLDRGEPTAADLIDTMGAMSMGVKLDRIVTRGGDAGETGRAGGDRVGKDDPVMVAGGDLDELSAALGLALSMPDVPVDQVELLRGIQNDLFDLGAELTVPSGRRAGTWEAGDGVPDPRAGLSRFDDSYVARLDAECERLGAGLPPLDSFLLLGGGSGFAAQLQVCRAVCRRAERSVVASGEAGPAALAYLNRLSDLLFIAARAAEDGAEVDWEPGGSRPAG
jgi:cob(I)alamin adenosyltransferase